VAQAHLGGLHIDILRHEDGCVCPS
jgi:hypothetical protein